MNKDKIEFTYDDVDVPMTKEEYKEHLSQLKIEHDEEKWNVFEIGKWGICIGHNECFQFEDKGCCQGIRMYMDHTAHDFNKETFCLFQRTDNNKYFYANIVLAHELGPHEAKFLPIPLSEVPMDLLLDFVYPYPTAIILPFASIYSKIDYRIMKAIINENFLKETIAKSICKVLNEIDWKTYANARDKQQVHKKRDWDRKSAFNDMSAERFLDDYGYGDETGKISANKFRTNGYNYDFNPTMVNNQGIEFGNPEYFISNKNDYYLKNHEPGKWYVGTQYEDGDEVYPRMVSPNFDTYEEAVRFANDNGLSYDTGLPSEKLKSAYDKAKKEFHDFRTSYYVTHPYDKESNYEYDNQKGWHLKDKK